MIGKLRFLNANALKFLAAALMVVDHVGLLFFPYNLVFRAIGRISMPLFAFAVSEGCRYTKNKIRHFALIAGLAVICQLVYYFFDGSLYMCILVTFSFSILTIYAMQYLKKTLFTKTRAYKRVLAAAIFIGAIVFTYLFCRTFTVDYGFWGCMLPVFASLFDFRGIDAPEWIKRTDVLPVRVLCLGIGLLVYCLQSVSFLPVWWAMLAVPILLLYNGNKGKWKTKYFFYVFYPLHLVALEGIFMLLH